MVAAVTGTKKVVVITGVSSGFGRLTAMFLARNGYRVFATMRGLSGRNAGAAEELRKLARDESLDLDAAEMDVTEDVSVEGCLRDVVHRAGRVDVLVNNAGFGYMGLLESFSLQQARRIFETNVMGPLRTIRAVLPHMHRQGEGLLIQVSSGAGRVVLPSMGLYCASKFALEALTESYRYELASAGIDSVSVEPGAYPTEILGKIEARSRRGAGERLRRGRGGWHRRSAARCGPRPPTRWTCPGPSSPSSRRPRAPAPSATGSGEARREWRRSTRFAADVQEQLLSAFGVTELTRFKSRGGS